MSNALHVPGDAATARMAEGTRSPAHPRLVIATTIMASSLAFIDGSCWAAGDRSKLSCGRHRPAVGRRCLFASAAVGCLDRVGGDIGIEFPTEFDLSNRNKRSVSIDLKRTEGRATFMRLARIKATRGAGGALYPETQVAMDRCAQRIDWGSRP